MAKIIPLDFTRKVRAPTAAEKRRAKAQTAAARPPEASGWLPWLTLYQGARNPVPLRADPFETWAELCADLEYLTGTEAAEKTDLLAIGPHRLTKPYRLDANVAALDLLALDVDRCDAVALLDRIEALGIAAAVYGSPSDDPAKPDARRVRVLSPASRPILPAECAATRLAFAELLELEPGCGAEACLSPGGLFFVGRIEGTAPRAFAWRDGSAVDVDGLLAVPLERDWHPGKASTGAAPAAASGGLPEAEPTDRAVALGALLADRWLDGGRIESHAWLNLAGWLLGRGWRRAELVALLDALDEGEPSAAKRAEHRRILSRAVALDGPGAAREWLGSDFEAVDRFANPEREAARAMLAERAARAPAPLAAAPTDAITPPEFTLGRGNAPAPTHANVLALLDVAGDRLRLESFTGRIVVAGMPPEAGYFPDGEWTDACTTEFTALCERLGLNVGRQTVAASVVAHARRRGYNALTEHARRLADGWDGTPRADGAMARYWGAEPGAAAAAVSRVFLLSLAARALRPGVKVDTSPVLIGPQGIGKSRSLRALVGDALFADSPLPIGSGDKDAMQVLRGTWLWELAEGVGLSRQDRNAVKAFLSSQADKFRASYAQFSELVPRQTVFAASTNEHETLSDHTGARRFLPVHVGVTRPIDVDGVAADHEQLLGEAARRVLAGEGHWPTPAEEAALAGARTDATEADPWEAPIADWAERNATPAGVTVAHVAACALGVEASRLGKSEQGRIASVLRGLGWAKRPAGRDRIRTWFPPTATASAPPSAGAAFAAKFGRPAA